jgi:hypothetical protein
VGHPFRGAYGSIWHNYFAKSRWSVNPDAIHINVDTGIPGTAAVPLPDATSKQHTNARDALCEARDGVLYTLSLLEVA